MSDPISTFFDAWQFENSDARLEKITNTVIENIQYDDPRTSETISGIKALNEYVGMFSANDPGWSAKVISSNTTAGITRATVAFSGMGPDNKEIVQLGQYFVEKERNLISRMVGFAGLGNEHQA